MPTVREMQIQFIQRLRKYEDVGLTVETDKLLGYLDRSQEDIIVTIMREQEDVQASPENVLERIGGTKRFIRTSAELTPVTESGDVLAVPNLFSFSLPADFLYYVKSFSFMTRSGSTGSYVENELINYMDFGPFIQTETNLPYLRRPKVAQKEGGYVNVLCDYESTVTKFQIVYIRKPKRFSLSVNDTTFTTTAEIDDNLIQRIIEDAISSYIQDQGNTQALLRLSEGGILNDS